MKKRYITSQELLHDSYSLAADILQSGFHPTFIVGIWRGGTPIGIAVQEVLEVCGMQCDHIAVRVSSYQGINQRSKKVRVHDLSYIIEHISSDDRLLIVDDVHDSGLSVEALIKQIHARCRNNSPNEIKIATAYFKPSKNKVNYEPDFYVKQTDEWLVFPHELNGLNAEEIAEQKPEIGHIRGVLLSYLK